MLLTLPLIVFLITVKKKNLKSKHPFIQLKNIANNGIKNDLKNDMSCDFKGTGMRHGITQSTCKDFVNNISQIIV